METPRNPHTAPTELRHCGLRRQRSCCGGRTPTRGRSARPPQPLRLAERLGGCRSYMALKAGLRRGYRLRHMCYKMTENKALQNPRKHKSLAKSFLKTLQTIYSYIFQTNPSKHSAPPPKKKKQKKKRQSSAA